LGWFRNCRGKAIAPIEPATDRARGFRRARGNILSAQFFAAATKAHPDIASEIASGQFGTLHGWLSDNVCRHGRTLSPEAIIARATGSPMTMAPYLTYLRKKYGEIYRLPQS
jgi:carboxypeptidase Taq